MLNNKVSRVLAAKTTKFSARKGSSFLYFVYDRDTSTLSGYTKVGTVITAVVTRSTLWYFLSVSMVLRGQVFAEIISDYNKGLAIHKLSHAGFANTLAGVNREIVLPARKKGHFQDFKVRFDKSEDKFTVTGLLKVRGVKLRAVLDHNQMAKFATTPLSQSGKAFAALANQSGK